MEGDLENFRAKALRLIDRLIEQEDRLSADAEREDDQTMSLVHEHGSMCLREAAQIVRTADGV